MMTPFCFSTAEFSAEAKKFHHFAGECRDILAET